MKIEKCGEEGEKKNDINSGACFVQVEGREPYCGLDGTFEG